MSNVCSLKNIFSSNQYSPFLKQFHFFFRTPWYTLNFMHIANDTRPYFFVLPKMTTLLLKSKIDVKNSINYWKNSIEQFLRTNAFYEETKPRGWWSFPPSPYKRANHRYNKNSARWRMNCNGDISSRWVTLLYSNFCFMVSLYRPPLQNSY